MFVIQVESALKNNVLRYTGCSSKTGSNILISFTKQYKVKYEERYNSTSHSNKLPNFKLRFTLCYKYILHYLSKYLYIIQKQKRAI